MTTAPHAGWLATVNPVVKIVATLVPLSVILFTRDVATPAIVAAGVAGALSTVAGLRARTLAVGAVVLLLVSAWTSLLFALLVRPDLVAGTPVVIESPVTVRSGALQIGAATALRMIAVMLLALLGSVGTTPDRLASALVHQCRVPYRFAYGTVATLRFVPRYRQDVVTLRDAHRARGIIDPPGPVGYLRRSGRSLVPLLAGGIRHAERISLAMDARGFGAFTRRTDRDPAVLRARDWAFLVAVWAGVALAYVVTARLGLLTMTGQIHRFA